VLARQERHVVTAIGERRGVGPQEVLYPADDGVELVADEQDPHDPEI